MAKADENVTAVDAHFERFLYADYKGVLPGWGPPQAAFFEDSRPEHLRPSNIYSPASFGLSSKSMEHALKVGKGRGYEFPQLQLAHAELASAQRRYGLTSAFNKIKDAVSGPLVWAAIGATALSLAVVVNKIGDTLFNPVKEAYLNAAVPVAGQPGLAYNADRQTYYQKTGTPRQLLSWTFNEKGDIEEACSIGVRQPNDGALEWWMVPKYRAQCVSGAALSQLNNIPAHPLPRPQ